MKKSNSIPIENIYYMLCYSWDKLQYLDRNKVGKLELKDIKNLITIIIVKEVNSLVKRGIHKNYIMRKDELSVIRGKINFKESIVNLKRKKSKVNCSYDELNRNILLNQIIKQSLLNLLKIKSLSKARRREIKVLLKYFIGVDGIRLKKESFKIRYNKLNKNYEFIINLCKLLYDNLLISEDGEEAEFYNFIEDERKMAYLFENFVRNFYKRELKDAKVYRENIKWNLQGNEIRYIPNMQTDISLEYRGQKYIIDTKYYKEALKKNYHKEKIISTNLYQIFAYLKNNENKSDMDKSTIGILLYPRVHKDINLSYKMNNQEIRINTLNLNDNWENIHQALIRIL